MVRMCIYPGCESKMTSWTSLSFHRLPLRDRDLLRLWLIALNMDPSIKVPTLRRLDYRVCSAHFTSEDFYPAQERIEGQKTKRMNLKKNAIPAAAGGGQVEEPEEAMGKVPEIADLSMSFGELELDPADTSYMLPSSKSSSSTGTMSGSASLSGDTGSGWGEKKWLVNESHLLQLFQICPQCKSLITVTKITTKGSQIKIHWSCGKHHGEWQSCPDRRGMPENNLLLVGSTVFTGSTYTDIADWATLLNVPIPHQSQFYRIQKVYILPAIEGAYKKEHNQIISRLVEDSRSGQRLELCGDARCDSPGKHNSVFIYC
uniref:THAP-type domain-containing protein n=1 Tax=Salarias fasciatus TaxID=181472 RepID=A0A672FVP1_SALFA